jgi:hypothetical protein
VQRRWGPRNAARIAHAAVLLALPTLGACGSPRAYQPDIEPQTLDQSQYLHYLAGVPLVTVDEATRAVLILADGEDPFETYEERIAELQDRDVVRAAWGLQADHVIDKSTFAYMLFKVCQLPPSVNTVLLGSWGLGDRRYALREAIFAGLLSYGTEYEEMTGGEFVAALARADAYMAEHGRYDSTEREIDAPRDLNPPRGEQVAAETPRRNGR